MDLAQKLESLKAKQLQIEAQMAAQIAREDAVALGIFSQYIAGRADAVKSLLNSRFTQALSKKDRALLQAWADRIDAKISTPVDEPASNPNAAPQSSVAATEKPHVS